VGRRVGSVGFIRQDGWLTGCLGLVSQMDSVCEAGAQTRTNSSSCSGVGGLMRGGVGGGGRGTRDVGRVGGTTFH